MKPIHNRSHTRFEIEVILNKIKYCAANDQYIISLNEHRQENVAFINEYHLCAERQKSLLSLINVNDFCYSIQNTKNGFENEILYVFVPQIKLYNTKKEFETMNIYMKFNILHMHKVIIVSFHKLNRSVQYLFR